MLETFRPTPGLVGIPRKSRNAPGDLDRAMRSACRAAVGIDVPLPVFHDGRVVGVVRGSTHTTNVMWCAINSYAEVTDALRGGRAHILRWTKGATAGLTAGNWYDLWAVGGDPASGTYPGVANTAVQWNENSTGAFRHGGDVSPSNKHLIRMEGSGVFTVPSTNTSPSLLVYDRVLTYEASSITTVNQVMTNTLAAQRYITPGEPGLKVTVTTQTAVGATASAYTQFQYTDQNGNALQSAPVAANVNVITSASAPSATLGARVVTPAVSAGTVAFGPHFPLASGDTGVRLIDNVTFSANNTGTLAYVLNYPIAILPILNGPVPIQTMTDQVMQLTSFGQVKDGACLAMMLYAATTTGATYGGRFDFVWG